MKETVAPKELNHFNRLRAATISASLAPGYSLGEALDYLERVVSEIKQLNPSFKFELPKR